MPERREENAPAAGKAAKHEYELLKALALMRKKTKEGWTEKHRNVVRKLFLEGGWVQRRLFDIGLVG